MKLPCDVCGHVLTELPGDRAVCGSCGMEYGPERLQELRQAAKPTPVTDPKPTPEKPKQQQKSGCGIWFWIILGLLDLIIGTHGIVAVFCLIILLCIVGFSKKK